MRYDLRYDIIKEKLQMAIVWRLPKWLIMWAAIRLFANATTGKYSGQIVTELTAIEALKRWN